MKLLIFDSGPLINLSMNGLLPMLEKLKQTFQGKFLITPEVRRETYERPLKISQFELGALKIKELMDQKVLELPNVINVTDKKLNSATQELMQCANHMFKADDHWITIVSEAEMSCIALAQQAQELGHDVRFIVDERTARLLCESPTTIERLMSQKLHRNVSMQRNCAVQFKGVTCLRSSELVYVAYKRGAITLHDDHALEALIYATKYKGAAISWDEINILKKL